VTNVEYKFTGITAKHTRTTNRRIIIGDTAYTRTFRSATDQLIIINHHYH